MNFNEFIKENYNTLGMKKCVELLNTTKGKVQTIVKKNNLKVDKKSLNKILSDSTLKTGDKCNVSIINFTENINKYSVYLLGLLWADGYIAKNTKNTKQRYNINIECLNEDMEFFKTILDKIGKWNYYTRKRGDWQTITKANTCNKELLEYLSKHDYNNKSVASPCLIIKTIPNNLLKYFLLGIIDGDGCFYFNKKHFLRQFSICGSLNQDWTAFEKIFNELGIVYKISRRPNNKGGSSLIRILNKNNIKKLGDYIYNTISDDKIGLPRKYAKYLEIIG